MEGKRRECTRKLGVNQQDVEWVGHGLDIEKPLKMLCKSEDIVQVTGPGTPFPALSVCTPLLPRHHLCDPTYHQCNPYNKVFFFYF